MKKVVALIFGGRSAEHEVSLCSAKNVAAAVDRDLFEPVLIGISKEGSWYHFSSDEIFEEITTLSDNVLPKKAMAVSLTCQNGEPRLFYLNDKKSIPLHIAFPILHGTYGEDGCIQGLFKMMNLPFVGCGIFACAVGMDKELMKRLLKEAHIPFAKYKVLDSHHPVSFESIEKELGCPFFIKPANAGSSVGVHKIKSSENFDEFLKDAFLYDHKVLAEEFVHGREIECSVLGLNREPFCSLPGEIVPKHEFYSYEAKYLDENGAELKIPAELTNSEIHRIQDLAKRTFKVLNCDGLARVDFFLLRGGEAIVNEINTIPGFTKISMYPKLWEASGLSYKALITKLIELGFEKFKDEKLIKLEH